MGVGEQGGTPPSNDYDGIDTYAVATGLCENCRGVGEQPGGTCVHCGSTVSHPQRCTPCALKAKKCGKCGNPINV